MVRHSSLGTPKVSRKPSYGHSSIGRVTANDRYEEYGIIEVILLNYSTPFPVWVVGDIDRKPEIGDQVAIGYLDGRKDAPYLAGFVKNYNYTTNFIQVHRDRIRLQLPKWEIGTRDGVAHNDTKEHLLNEDKLETERVYVELSPDEAVVSFPVDKSETVPPAHLKITSEGIEAFHPTGNFNVRLPNGYMDVTD